MNKIGLYVCCLLFCMTFMTVGCSGNAEKEWTRAEEDSLDREIDKLFEGVDASENLSAISTAQQFIREQFASNAEFESEGTIVDETDVPGRYKVIQKFSAEDHPSNWSKFIYRIWVQKFDNGWEFGNLQVENISGQKIFTTNGNMKKREQTDGVGDTMTVAGISFKIAEKKPTAIRLYTPKKLSRAELSAATKELKDQYSSIQYSTEAKHERGDEYASWAGSIFCDYDAEEVIGEKEFLK